MQAPSSWTLSPYAICRVAGYPLDWLLRIADPDWAASVEALLTALDAMTARRRELSARATSGLSAPGAPASLTRRAQRCLRAGREVPDDCLAAAPGPLATELRGWNRQVACLVQRLEGLQGDTEALLERHRDRVTGLFRDHAGLRDAVLLSSPEAAGTLRAVIDEAGADVSRRERRLDTLVAYLQRFCAKNDTNSHFGPFATVRVDDALPGLG